jgi:cyclase
VRGAVVVKGVQFRNHRVMGDILDLATRYRDEGADELVFYDITASPDGRTVDRSWVNRVAAVLDIPFCVAGGIRSLADAESVLNFGAEKISVNSPALENPDLVNELVRRFGSQCIVIGCIGTAITTSINTPVIRSARARASAARSIGSGKCRIAVPARSS